MKIATYNLRKGGSGSRVHWRKIFEAIAPDIFLVQESYAPNQYMPAQLCQLNQDRLLWSKAGTNKWGSALFVKHGQITPIEIPDFVGWVVGAEVTQFNWLEKRKARSRVFSIHASTTNKSIYIGEVNSILDFIASFTDEFDLIIGGDFNFTVGIRHEHEELKNHQQELRLLNRIQREFGLINCWQAANPNCFLPQTLRWSGNKTIPYHCDGIFVPATWYPYLRSCDVLASKDWELLSDHNPVVANFESDTTKDIKTTAVSTFNHA